MKKLFLIVLVLLPFIGLQAQVNVVLVRDTARFSVSIEKLKQQYPPFWGGKESPVQKLDKKLLDTLNQHRMGNKLTNFLMKNEKQIGIKNFSLFTDEFVGPTGQYDWVFCAITAKAISEQQENEIVKLLTAYYKANPFPIKTPKGFRQSGGLVYGGGYAKRMVRKGPGIISSLEDAQKTTRPDTVKILLLNQLELTSIPKEVYQFPNLEELDLSKNAIRSLPKELTANIPKLLRLSLLQNSLSPDSISFTRNKHLLALNIQGNKLSDIPRSVRQNRRLASLWIGNNPLDKGLTNRSFRRLRRLNDLNLYNAGLAVLPQRISRLKRLQTLDVYYNKLTELPKSVGRLKQLSQLAVAHNQLKTLPDALGRVRGLQVVYAHHNQLSELPASYSNLQQLRVLDIGYNWFSMLPPVLPTLTSLEEVDLSNNNLSGLPPTMSNLTKLKKLFLRQNPFTKETGKPETYAELIDKLEANKTEVFY